MKNITPKTEYRGDDYPSADQAGVTRRGLLQVMLTGGAGVGAAAVGMGVLLEDADARRGRLRGRVSRPRYRAYIDLTPDYRYRGCKSAIAGLMVVSYDRTMADYFKKKKVRKAAQKEIRAVLRGFRCSDLKKQRYKIQRAVAYSLKKFYQKRTKRRAGHTYVQLKLKTATS